MSRRESAVNTDADLVLFMSPFPILNSIRYSPLDPIRDIQPTRPIPIIIYDPPPNT